MPHISQKHASYSWGLALVIISWFMYIFAFGIPAWEKDTVGQDDAGYSGFWQYACRGFSNCQTYPLIVNDVLFQASRSVACIALVFYCVSVFLLCINNCTSYARRAQSENTCVSVFSIISGLIALASTVMYVILIETSFSTPTGKTNVTYTYSWAFILATVANGLTILGGLLLVVGVKLDRRTPYKEDRRDQVLEAHRAGNQVTTFPVAMATGSQNMALVAVPLSCLTPSGSLTNMAVVGRDFQGSELSETNTSHRLAVSSNPSLIPASTGPGQGAFSTSVVSAPQLDPSSTPVSSGPRLDPSAPPPELTDFYY